MWDVITCPYPLYLLCWGTQGTSKAICTWVYTLDVFILAGEFWHNVQADAPRSGICISEMIPSFLTSFDNMAIEYQPIWNIF